MYSRNLALFDAVTGVKFTGFWRRRLRRLTADLDAFCPRVLKFLVARIAALPLPGTTRAAASRFSLFSAPTYGTR